MDLKKIKNLISLVENADISHLSIESDDSKIEIKKEINAPATSTVVLPQAAPAMAPAPAVAAPAAAPAADVKEASDANLIPIKAQMVGTYYGSPNPESPAYVKVGDTIKQGQVICIIEAMKLFNEIESEISGTIEKICVDNSSPVEYGQDLFLVRAE